MSEKRFNGKAIYNPSGKAGEYSYWACNFYVGCSNMCEYCYCKKGILSNVMGQNKAQLKMCFKDETDALAIFKKELIQNISQLQQHGLFFSFTTDPMLEETHKLHWEAICFAMENNVPVKILTKCVGGWVDQLCTEVHPSWKKFLAIGFTLTGHDELEGNSASTKERIRAMVDLHKAGYKTFTSIEPVVDFISAYSMISLSHGAGRLMSRSKAKETLSMDEFVSSMNGIFTTSVSTSTIDEAPQAYKAMDEIKNAITDTVEIIDTIKPIYNFKASD